MCNGAKANAQNLLNKHLDYRPNPIDSRFLWLFTSYLSSIRVFRWEAFREMALKRQNEQTEVVTRLQEIEVGEIRDWMTSTEDRISR